jgi:hypothetical protein
MKMQTSNTDINHIVDTMKCFRIRRWASHLALTLGSVLGIVTTCVAVAGPPSVTVEVKEPAKPYGTIAFTGASLTELNQSISGETGQCKVEYKYDFNLNASYKACCKGEPPEIGAEVTFASEKQKVTIVCGAEIKIPVWQDAERGDISCQSAIAEWNRYADATKGHEERHWAVAKSFFQSNAPGYFQIGYYISECLSNEGKDAYLEETANKIQAELDTCWGAALAAYATCDDTDIKEPPGVGQFKLDTTKDCP